MTAAVVYKVRCPSCGKSLKIDSADAAAQIVCRACGVRVELPAAPLLGPISDDVSAIPLLTAVSARPLSLTPLTPTSLPLPGRTNSHANGDPAASPTWGPASAVEVPHSPPAVDPAAPAEPVGSAAASGWPLALLPAGTSRAQTFPAAVPTPEPVAITHAAGDLPPWAAVSNVPATPPPPANVLPPASIAPPHLSPGPIGPPPRLVPTRLERADPDEEQVRLGYVPAPPVALPLASQAPRSTLSDPPATPFDPLADTAVHPALAQEIADGSPTDEDIRTILAAHRAGQLRLVDNQQRRGHPFWWTLLGMLSAAAIVLIALAGTGQIDWFDPWEKQATPTIAKLKAEAEAFAVRGALKESHERYQKIDELVAGRPVRDPYLRAIVDNSRDSAKQVYALLLSRMGNDGAPANPPAPASAGNDRSGGSGTTGGAGRAVASATPIKPAPSPSSPDTLSKPAEPKQKPPAVAEAPRPRPAPARRVRPALRPVIADANGPITDAEIGKSIEAGVNHLLKQFDDKTHTLKSGERSNDKAYFCGMDALAVYALLQAGQAIDDPRISHRGAEMKAKLEALRNLPIEGSHQTYARGLRATALALFNRGEDFKVMANDVDWLLGTTDGGAYTYDGDYRSITQRGNFATRNGSWDNSNSQYGLLGVWSGIEADPRIEVPLAYWQAVDRHWTKCQSKDGQWGYGEGGDGGRLTMTCAGIASLFVAHEYLEPATTVRSKTPQMPTTGREPFSPALKKGLEWFERGNNSVNVRGGNWWGYALYGIERVGLASGFKHFGSHDWYRELSEQIVARQLGNGSWGDGVVDTSYALLFLSRGRHPILMNKLRFDGYWANRPRDASNMARYASRQFERPINWQVVNVENPWTDWTDSPILYIASHEPPSLTADHIDKLRSFVRSGGMIFTHADGGSLTFDAWARELAAKLFKYEMTELPENHPLWTSVYKLTARPPLWGVSNGSRLLMLHSPSDITLRWQQRADRAFESRPDPAKPAGAGAADSQLKTSMLSPFYFGMNLFVYAAGKRDLRNRLDSAWTLPPSSSPIDTIRIARLQYGGNWDPEPGAWERYANWFHQTTGTRLDVQPIRLGDLNGETVFTYPFAHLTGTARVGFSDAEAAALRAYVEGGGVVLIDPTGGMNAFDNEVRETLLVKTLPGRFPRLLGGDHPLMSRSAPGMQDVSKTIVRGYTLERLGGGIGTVQIVTPTLADGADNGRPESGAIIVTSLDLTSGLLGTNAWGILGFQNSYAQNLVKNAIFWSVDGRAQQ